MAEKKEYRSAVRSRRMIRQAFMDLLHEKPLEKITATDIIRRADINRSTFYAHYPDVGASLRRSWQRSLPIPDPSGTRWIPAPSLIIPRRSFRAPCSF